MPEQRISRRGLLRSSASAAAATGLVAQSARSAERILGANDRLSVGIVGPGGRGTTLMEWVHRLSKPEKVEMTAVCDIWNRRREAASARVREWGGRAPRACRTMAEICDLQDVDALIVATADFQHAPLTRQAVKAGKDVYVEKPFGCDFEQIELARDAVKESGQIVQMGTQRRSHGVPWAAREFVKSGRLGKVSYVALENALFQQRWRIPGSETSLTEKDTDWNEFLSYTPRVPFDARRYREFRLFWPYSTGIFCQWMSHVVDLVNLVLDELPKAVVAGGGVYVWEDGRTNPDTAQCLIEYPSGCMMSYHMRLGNGSNGGTLNFYGTKGTLDLYAGMAHGHGGGGEVMQTNLGRSIPAFVTDASKRLPDREKGGVILEAEPDRDHMSDFFDAVRNRRPPRADVDAGFAHALACTMAGASLRTGARIEYDAATDTIRPTIRDREGYPTTAAHANPSAEAKTSPR